MGQAQPAPEADRCPFYEWGGVAFTRSIGIRARAGFVFCPACKACGPVGGSRAKAIALWNRARRRRPSEKS